PYDTTYSTPMLTRVGGRDLLVFGSGDGAVWGMQPGTGKMEWKAQLSRRGLNVSPVVSPDGMVFTGHSEENTVGNTMGAFVSVDATTAGAATSGSSGPAAIADNQLRWKNYQVMAGKSSPLFIDGKVYATTDSAKMLVFDGETGRQLERKALGRVSRGTPVYADGKIYYCSRGGRFYILKPKADGTLDTVFRTSLRGEQVDASPIVAGGRLYLTTSEAVYCIGNEESIAANAAAAPAGEAPEAAAGEPADQTPAYLTVSPYDVLLKPGESVEFTLRVFNAGGELIETQPGESVRWSSSGEGASLVVDPPAVRFSPSGSHEAYLVTASYAGLSASARVRSVPPLPWAFDFESGAEDVPLTWVGGRVRYNLREDDAGNHYLAKPTELPTRPGKPTTKLGTRSRMWMGPSDLADYTVQADVQMQTGIAGESGGGAGDGSGDDAPLPELPTQASSSAVKLPSVGLINSRYTFTLFGPNNEARLYSWCTHDKRTQAVQPIAFEPGVWYTMKLRVVPKPEAGVATVSAKVWRRGEAEPGGWTLEFDDPEPNYQGSPGLFGDAKEAEFYLDNLSVTPNE
ncbi:MAG: hypothetical protein AAF790_08175, partial [Planctomycetota bacterium]